MRTEQLTFDLFAWDTMEEVNETPQEIILKAEEVMEAVGTIEDWGNWDAVKEVGKFLGQGAYGKVYALTDDICIKITRSRRGSNDGRNLKEVQGLPFIPKLYAYNERFIVMQRIKGIEVGDLRRHENFTFKVNKDELMREVERFCDMADEKGIQAGDLHSGNLMVEPEGFYIVDVGNFRPLERDSTNHNWAKSELKNEITWLYDDLDWNQKQLRRKKRQENLEKLKESDNELGEFLKGLQLA